SELTVGDLERGGALRDALLELVVEPAQLGLDLDAGFDLALELDVALVELGVGAAKLFGVGPGGGEPRQLAADEADDAVLLGDLDLVQRTAGGVVLGHPRGAGARGAG